MRLAQFISQQAERIVREWEAFAATRLPAAGGMTVADRRDHIEAILERIREDLAESETAQDRSEKAHGEADAEQGIPTAAKTHGAARAESGYTPDQMVSEFRALRACVVRLWLDEAGSCDRQGLEDLARFHEAIDQALAESLQSFTQSVEHAKELFLGVLGHDLRTPLTAVLMGATALITEEGADWPHAKIAARILRSGTRMEHIIHDLLDFTRERLAGGIPVTRDEMDLDALLRENIDELATLRERCPITLTSPGPVFGTWDRARLGQALANLIGNACQHGAAGEPIAVTLGMDQDTAVVAVHNKGPMIAPHALRDIFEPFRRLGSGKLPSRNSKSIGLGLFIAKAIVSAHQGTIDVTSTKDGTTFTVRLPWGSGDLGSAEPRRPESRFPAENAATGG